MTASVFLAETLTQAALYWPPATPGHDGRPSWGTPSEVSVRWEDRLEEIVDARGETRLSRARVFLDQDVKPNGVLLLVEAVTTVVDEDYEAANYVLAGPSATYTGLPGVVVITAGELTSLLYGVYPEPFPPPTVVVDTVQSVQTTDEVIATLAEFDHTLYAAKGADPLANEGAWEIRSFKSVLGLDGDEQLRVAYL